MCQYDGVLPVSSVILLITLKPGVRENGVGEVDLLFLTMDAYIPHVSRKVNHHLSILHNFCAVSLFINLSFQTHKKSNAYKIPTNIRQ